MVEDLRNNVCIGGQDIPSGAMHPCVQGGVSGDGRRDLRSDLRWRRAWV